MMTKFMFILLTMSATTSKGARISKRRNNYHARYATAEQNGATINESDQTSEVVTNVKTAEHGRRRRRSEVHDGRAVAETKVETPRRSEVHEGRAVAETKVESLRRPELHAGREIKASCCCKDEGRKSTMAMCKAKSYHWVQGSQDYQKNRCCVKKNKGCPQFFFSYKKVKDIALCESAHEVKEMKDAGFSALDMKQAGYPADRMKVAGYTAQNMVDAHYTIIELRSAGYSAKEIKKTGATADKLFKAGYSAVEVKDIGYTAADVRNAGYTAVEMKRAGFNTSEMKAAGYTAAELRSIGHFKQ